MHEVQKKTKVVRLRSFGEKPLKKQKSLLHEHLFVLFGGYSIDVFHYIILYFIPIPM